MGQPTSRRLRGCLLGLCLLIISGMALPGVAAADPSAPSNGPTTSPTHRASPSARPSSTPIDVLPTSSINLRPDAFSVLVTPARMVVTPGDLHETHRVEVVNRGQAKVGLVVERRNFTAGPDGSLQFDPNAPYAAADWVDVKPAAFSLDPGEVQRLTIQIDVPEEAEPGDHNVAVVILAPGTSSNGNVRVNRGIATPIYIGVPGQTDDTVVLRSLTTVPISLTGAFKVTATLENVGNTHRDFRGATALTVDSAGRTARFPDVTILRGSTRVVSTILTPPLVCVCHPTVEFPNAGGASQEASNRVIVFPWWLAAGLLVVLAITLAILVAVRRRLRAAALAPKPMRAAPPGPDPSVSPGGG